MMADVAPPLSASYRMANRIMGGRLDEQLRYWRSAGVSWRAIAILLRREGVEVSFETARKWGKQLGTDDAAEVVA